MRNEKLDLHGKYVLADNGLIHEEIIALFAKVFKGEYPHEMPGLPAPEFEVQNG